MSILQRKMVRAMEESGQSYWTIETLREHFISIISSNEIKYSERFEASQSAVNAAFLAQQTALTAQKLAVDTALGAADRAVTKAELAAEKRFESVNEFCASLSDQQRTLMPRTETELLIKTLADKFERLEKEIASLRESRSETNGKSSGANALWGYIVAAVGIALGIIFHFVK